MTRCVKRLLVASLRCTTLPSASLHTSPRLCDIPVVPFLIEQEGRGERAYNIYSRLLKDRIICVMGGLSRYNPKSAKQKPLMSYIVGDDTRVPSRSYQPPIAVKRGPPSTGLGHEFNGATDIWIYKDAADTWEPPSEHREVLDRTKCKIFEEVIKLASESKTPGQITPEEKRRSDLWMADQKLETFIEGSYPRATGTWPMKRLCGLWLRYLSESISDGWPNGKGKMALYYLFMTATVVCEMSEDRQIDLPYCLPTIEGQGPLNKGNGKYAIRAVDTGEQVDLLRGKSQWEVESGYWGYRYIIPDVSLEVSPSSSEGFLQPTGWMFGEVNSLDDHVMLDQATLQALRGLVDLTQTAAVVVHPKELYFIHLNVEKGFLVRRWKQYNVIKRGIADHTQYVEFFRDIVLYLRNTYYAKDAFDW